MLNDAPISTLARLTRRTGLVAALLCPAMPAFAQGECRPSENSNEAKLLAFFATPISFSPGGLVRSLPTKRVRIGFEASDVPSPSREIQEPEACYGIKKTENTNLSPIFPRPRIWIGLPLGLILEGSYLPPVHVADAEPNLGSVALSLPLRLAGSEQMGGMGVMLRGHATYGRVRGSITCPKKKLQQTDPTAACYGEIASADTYKPNMYGAEGAVVLNGPDARWGAYAAPGVTWLQPRFRVGFQYLSGAFDNTKIIVDMTRFAAGVGGWYRINPGTTITGELYSVPSDATTFRIGAVLGSR
jgi:hypothetical protein